MYRYSYRPTEKFLIGLPLVQPLIQFLALQAIHARISKSNQAGGLQYTIKITYQHATYSCITYICTLRLRLGLHFACPRVRICIVQNMTIRGLGMSRLLEVHQPIIQKSVRRSTKIMRHCDLHASSIIIVLHALALIARIM